MRKMLCIAALALAAPALSATAGLKVASLSTVLSDVARNVGGDKVQVIAIVKPGMDPHLFEPNTREIRTMSQAQIILANGLGFEAYLPKLRESLGRGPVFVVAGDAIKPIVVSASEPEDEEHAHTHRAGEKDGKVADPHWFHSIANARIATAVIRDAFVTADPAHEAVYRENAAKYMTRLDALAKWVRLEIAKIPRARRLLVTSHDALGYFARDYEFAVHPVQGISTDDQPSSKKIRALIDEIKKARVKAIFAENIENPKVIEEITRETGAKLGDALYADGLGDKEAGTYEDMMRHNVTAIVTALQ